MKLTGKQIRETKKYLADKLGFYLEDIKDGAHLNDDLGVDSLDAIEILMEIELRFNIKIEDEEAYKCITVLDVINLIELYNK
ncbi:acyl carrier protein [Olleya phage Harreka_1]|uniref:Acyl carrier protein n=1 Tax=Olleya phage Harreka_1 TaxID=2745673 RepID=A0A8E5E8T4_9CAUD|nr:acyl carrier protein [Olleya phage Harreka_1]QQV90475.1 acyl carrier protein [Olleya phage Harreka_1]